MAAVGTTPELAMKHMVARTIPTDYDTESVTGSEGSMDLQPYAGKWIFLRSAGADITVRRASASPTLVAGEGAVITSAAYEEFYVDPNGIMTLWHISSGAVNLLILSDAEHR